ncbi:hypothetical protein K7395_16865 [Streptomyces filamentosus]|uniref:Uncharacterized protein n=2 Tax=Streptomyces filamentosus TaxID=67294 RepID=A0ABY4UW12_STRFL|nr:MULTISPECIES: DUF6578 domain-containing protein [Streptomyces]MYR80175.1 hypothetical protein [Streptomyces sp. SID5466]EFE76168.1 predicted protein [Streptomyces filamentosus NRRL 15998]ESU48201.1 hypothetical protein P376_3817 [Streptomyces sp. HCCB10043]EWS93159.1 hypothetical protein SSIG_03730 [Streptomyces filamentosus NRRL 11379]USC48294.1 hypothetical protein K7395_16865 [Streptomyces filamentosus]
MTVTIWVDDWQMQCCGEDFASGDLVSWSWVVADPEDYVDIVGEERAAEIDFHEEHHGQEEQEPTSLEVLSIAEVHCRYAVPPGSTDKVRCPVPGTAVLLPVDRATGWAKGRPDVDLAGYLVTARRVTDPAEGPSEEPSEDTVARGR